MMAGAKPVQGLVYTVLVTVALLGWLLVNRLAHYQHAQAEHPHLEALANAETLRGVAGGAMSALEQLFGGEVRATHSGLRLVALTRGCTRRVCACSDRPPCAHSRSLTAPHSRPHVRLHACPPPPVLLPRTPSPGGPGLGGQPAAGRRL